MKFISKYKPVQKELKYFKLFLRDIYIYKVKISGNSWAISRSSLLGSCKGIGESLWWLGATFNINQQLRAYSCVFNLFCKILRGKNVCSFYSCKFVYFVCIYIIALSLHRERDTNERRKKLKDRLLQLRSFMYNSLMTNTSFSTIFVRVVPHVRLRSQTVGSSLSCL